MEERCYFADGGKGFGPLSHFGRPAADTPHPQAGSAFAGKFVRQWRYACADGPLLLKAQISLPSGQVIVSSR